MPQTAKFAIGIGCGMEIGKVQTHSSIFGPERDSQAQGKRIFAALVDPNLDAAVPWVIRFLGELYGRAVGKLRFELAAAVKVQPEGIRGFDAGVAAALG